ncbi:transmembrane protein, partial [Fagus crenata]
MEDNHVALEDHEATTTTTNTHNNNDHGWQKVTYAKHQRKTAKPSAAATAILNKSVANATLTGADNVFLLKHRINDNDDSSDGEGDHVAENGKAEESKKVKAKKLKKPKVTVSDAAAKIDANDLSAFLANIM